MHNAKVLSDVPKHKKAVMCPTKKIHVLHKLCSGMSSSAVSCAFHINDPPIYTK